MRRLSDILPVKDNDPEPIPDLASCMDCRWSGKVSDCVKGEDGDWESGYFRTDDCPKCGGAVDYDMSDELLEAWIKWDNRRKESEKSDE